MQNILISNTTMVLQKQKKSGLHLRRQKTQGKRLAVGELKAVLARPLGAAETMILLQAALREEEPHAQIDFSNVAADGWGFYRICNTMWGLLRMTFLWQPDLNRLQGEEIGEMSTLWCIRNA